MSVLTIGKVMRHSHWHLPLIGLLILSIPALAGYIDYYSILEQKVITGNESEKKTAWQNFLESLPPYSSNDFGSNQIDFLEKILVKAPEPYKSMAWEEAKLRLEPHSYFFVNIVSTGPEPYRGLAWSELIPWQPRNRVYALHNFYRIVIEVPEPYKIFAWQKLEEIGSEQESNPTIEPSGYLTNIIQQAPEPYKWWGWNQLLARERDKKFWDSLFYHIMRNAPEPYKHYAWGEAILQQNEFWVKNLNYLKITANSSNMPLRYRKMAISKILSLEFISTENREQAEQMSLVFYSVENESSYAITWQGFRLEDNEKMKTDELKER